MPGRVYCLLIETEPPLFRPACSRFLPRVYYRPALHPPPRPSLRSLIVPHRCVPRTRCSLYISRCVYASSLFPSFSCPFSAVLPLCPFGCWRALASLHLARVVCESGPLLSRWLIRKLLRFTRLVIGLDHERVLAYLRN